MPKLIVGLISLTCVCLKGLPQKMVPLEFGFGPGAAVYQGDLSPHRFGSLHKAGLGFQLFSAICFHQTLSLRANFSFALLEESDQNYPAGYRLHRNFSFQTTVNEFSVQLIASPVSGHAGEAAIKIRPYVFAGVGWAWLNVQRDWNRFDFEWPHWQQWVREGLLKDSATLLPEATLVFPAGLGIRLFLGEKVSLFIEGGHRFTKEEYLDGFSRAANPKKRDAYTLFTAGIVFSRSFRTARLARRVY